MSFSFSISDPYPDIFLFHKYPQAFIINAIFLFYNVKNPVPWLFSFLHCFAISLHKYEQPLHLILIDITAVLMIFFIQLSKPLFLFLLFFYFSFGCFLYFFRIFYILFYVGMFFRVPIQFYLYKLIFSFFPARKFFRLLT